MQLIQQFYQTKRGNLIVSFLVNKKVCPSDINSKFYRFIYIMQSKRDENRKNVP